jgi:dTDP-4-dehydrorhamnose reductase
MLANEFLILGGNGFLGQYFAREIGERSNVHFSRETFGQTVQKVGRFQSPIELKDFVRTVNCRTVINCIALANIDESEKNLGLANWLNVEIPGILADICNRTEKRLVHISTDAVFGDNGSWKTEKEIPNPISVYGETKLAGEQLVLNSGGENFVFRVNFYGSSKKTTSLFEFFYNALKNHKEVNGYSDIYFNPMYAQHTVQIILKTLNQGSAGLYHAVGSERITKYDFGLAVAAHFNLDSSLIRNINMPQGSSIIRSKDLTLSNEKISSLGIEIPSLSQGLTALRKELRESTNEG